MILFRLRTLNGKRLWDGRSIKFRRLHDQARKIIQLYRFRRKLRV